ncbi:hypothetical protein C5167_005029 [Papaver somniferum]|uniref:Pentatricopeptide repeat-containing protein n=1 Tax=Papaver somniferum TaxID=3469 RepID=A0A4Y7JB43_PAPSO|nr:hypothetical protein C5167_005029 [Papaver somniferum]
MVRFGETVQDRFHPNVITITTLIKRLRLYEKTDVALNMFDKMTEAVNRLQDAAKLFDLMRYYIGDGRMKTAKNLFQMKLHTLQRMDALKKQQNLFGSMEGLLVGRCKNLLFKFQDIYHNDGWPNKMLLEANKIIIEMEEKSCLPNARA